MSDRQAKETLRNKMSQKETGELLAIWEQNDRDQYRDQTFEIIRQILVERGVAITEQKVAPTAKGDIAPGPKGIRGWLLLFCLGLTVFGPLGTLGNLKYFVISLMIFLENGFTRLSVILVFASGGDLVLSLLGIYIGVQLWGIHRQAVTLAKRYLLINWFVSLISAALLLLPLNFVERTETRIESDLGTLAILGIIWCSIWYSYLLNSKRVKATYET